MSSNPPLQLTLIILSTLILFGVLTFITWKLKKLSDEDKPLGVKKKTE